MMQDAERWHDQVNLVFSRLNEDQRRWVAGLLAKAVGWGGDTQLSRMTGLDAKTIKRGRDDLALGNVVGSCLFNALAILGFASVISPFYVKDVTFFDVLVFFLFALFLWFKTLKEGHFSRVEGALLCIFYFTYIFSLI